MIEEKGLTQRQFAELVGIHYITLCNNLKNDNFSHKSVEKIADALHLSIYDMLADEAQGKATFSNVEGYIEYNGKIQKIKDFRNLKKLVNDIEQQEVYMKARQAKLPKQKAITLDNITIQQWEEYDATQLEVKSWRDNWERLSAYFQYSQHIRRIIYTTNTVEGYHRQLRKVTKNKGVFTSDTALEKLVYLAFTRIRKKWTQPVQNWGQTAQQLAILLQDRFKILT